ncbi:hypothetical protein [Nocardiopsis coralliicola]
MTDPPASADRPGPDGPDPGGPSGGGSGRGDGPADGTEFPASGPSRGGYHAPDPGLLYGTRPERTGPPGEPAEPVPAQTGPQGPVPAGEPFRRTTPARRKEIPALPGGGRGRLAAGTALFVMVIGSTAGVLPPGLRAAAHLLFWAAVAAAALIALHRERANGWEPGPRWVWPAAAFGGSLLTEALIAVLGPAVIAAASVVVGGVFLLIVLLFG